MSRQRLQLGRHRAYPDPGPVLHPRDFEDLGDAELNQAAFGDPEPTSRVVEVPAIAEAPAPAVGPIQGTYTIPETSLPKLMWQAYVAGASWVEGEYPEWDDKTYYEDTPHGQAMLGDFIAIVEEMKRPPGEVARTMCAVGRPFRQHAVKCHPECDWTEDMR